MTTTGEEIFWRNASRTLRDIGMARLDPAHGAAVDTVRWCLLVRGRPTHHRQAFLEWESPALLAYLEKLSSSGEAQSWRTLDERIRFHAEVLREREIQPCARPWLAAVWHALPELAALGQCILDQEAKNQDPAPEVAPVAADTGTGAGGEGDNGSGGKTGSANSNKPRPSPRLAFPVVPVAPTEAERKALDLADDTDDPATKNDVTPCGPEGSDGPAGPKSPGGVK
jgi:hypothetical protein